MVEVRKLCVAACALAVALLSVRAASAQDAGASAAPHDASGAPVSDEVRREASTRFRRGVELFQEGAYRAALLEFERAYEIAPDYRLLYNIGQTRLQLQDYLAAAQAYERYLVEGGSEIPEERRSDVESALSAMHERVARLAITVSADGAQVFVDDQEVGVSPMPGTVTVNLGRHRVLARTGAGAAAERTVDVAGGDLLNVELTLSAPGVAVTARPVARRTPLRNAAIVAWTVGGAALAGAVLTGVLAGQKESDLDDELDKVGSASPSKVKTLRDSVDTLALTTDVLGGVAIAGVSAGVVLWLLGKPKGGESEPKSTAEAHTEWSVGFGTIMARRHF